MRTRRSLGVILHTEKGQVTMTKSLECLIVEVDVSDFDLIGRQRISVHHETVVLGCNLHLSLREVHYGMISAAVPEFQFIGPPTQRQA